MTSSPTFNGITFVVTSRAAALLDDAWASTPQVDDLVSLEAMPRPAALLLTGEDTALLAALPVAGVATLLVVRCERLPADVGTTDDVVFASAPSAEIEFRAERALRPRTSARFVLDEAGLRAGDTHVPLSVAEHRLLTTLLARPGIARSRAELYAALGADAEEGRALDAHIYRLRRKLAGISALRLETLRQRGFRVVLDDHTKGGDPARLPRRAG